MAKKFGGSRETASIYGRGDLGAPGREVIKRQVETAPKITNADKTALPILGKPEMESALVKHIMDRVKMSDEERKRRAAKAQTIDVQLSGYIKLSGDDKKRKRDNEQGRAPKPTDHNLPLAKSQINDCTTYLMSVYAPELDIFQAVAPADKQQMAQAVTYEINKKGQRGQYYRHMVKMCEAALKYNFGGLTCYWEKKKGLIFKKEAGGMVKKEPGITWEGNVINSINVYNFFYDTSVNAVDLAEKGEFFAEVERKTPFRVRKMAADGELFGIGRYVTENKSAARPGVPANNETEFYIKPPSVRDEAANAQSGSPNWVSILREGDVKESSPGIELITYVGWINPKEFGIGDDKLELWKIVVAQAKCITYMARLDDTHGMLPVTMAVPLEDDLVNDQRTYAEMLIPLQHFASFLLNSHQAATRKAIYGITVFNQNLFPGLDKDRDELIGGLFGFRPSGTDIDVDKAFRHYNASPDTAETLNTLPVIRDLMQQILPTDSVRQVADLERATLYQAAATVQASNRQQLKIARIISDQCLTNLKFMMLYNLYSNMTQITYIDEKTGKRIDVSVSDLVEAGIEHEISNGLKGLDRLMTIQIMRDVINSVIQSQQGIQEIDLVRLLNYYSNLAGDRTDLTQFRRVPAQQPVAGAAPGAPVAGTT